MPATGDLAPDFTLPDQDGNPWCLSEQLGNSGLLLYFYPADFTPVCTRQACMLRDIHSELAEAGMRIVGISPQDSASHREFGATHRLPFTLLADPQREVIREYGCALPLNLGVRRRTFLLDARRRIADVLTADFMASRHRDFARKALANLAGPQD